MSQSEGLPQSHARPTRNVPRKSFAEEQKLPRLFKVAPVKKKPVDRALGRKRKADDAAVIVELDGDAKRAKASDSASKDTHAESILWKNLKDQKQDELEEQLIARAFAKPALHGPKKAKPESQPTEFPSIHAAQSYCLNDCSFLCSDLTVPGAELLGQLAKIYWDGEETWFYARVLNFNASSGEYFVYYFEDNTGEWMDFSNEAAIVSTQLVLARTSKSASLWPALTFQVFPKAREALRKYPAFNAHGEYVEFLQGDKKYEYAFVQPALVEPFDHGFAPKKGNKKLQAALEEAQREKEAVDQVLNDVQAAIRKSVLSVKVKDQLVGTRVRAATSRILTRAERKMKPEERLNISSAFCVGTVAQYCPAKDMHLVTFDDPHLQPQWVEVAKAAAHREIEVILPTTAAAAPTAATATAASAPAAGTDGADSADSAETPDDGSDAVVPTCALCTHDCRPDAYGQDCLHCHRCGVACHEHCLPAGELIPVNAAARLKSSQWLCWRCTDCFNCASTSWHTPLIYWSSKNQVARLSDSRTLLLCGWCLKHYKHTREYCVVCYKLYVYQQHQPGASIEATYASDLTMVQCHQCDRWVHAACEGIDEQQYESISDGTHPIWGDEYLCPLCRVQLCRDVMKKLFALDRDGIFSAPVTEDIAANYFDVIHNPMDLATMLDKVDRGMYKSLQPLRQDAELVALNALIFNRAGDPVWRAAQQLFVQLSELFLRFPRHTERSAYGSEAEQILQARHLAQTGQPLLLPAGTSTAGGTAAASSTVDAAPRDKRSGRPKKSAPTSLEEDASLSREPDGSLRPADDAGDADGSDSDGGSDADASDADDSDAADDDFNEDAALDGASEARVVLLQQLALAPNPEPEPFLPPRINAVAADEASALCEAECCFACGATSEADGFLCCCHCGEAVHFFCAGIDEAQFRRMNAQARRDWRCVNCKVCELCLQALPSDAQTLLFCELCDRSFHIGCLRPTIAALPDFAFVCGCCVACDLCDSLRAARPPSVDDDDARRRWGNCANLCVACQDTVCAAAAPQASLADAHRIVALVRPDATPPLPRVVAAATGAALAPGGATEEARRFLAAWTVAGALTDVFYRQHFARDELLPPVPSGVAWSSKGAKRAAIAAPAAAAPATSDAALVAAAADVATDETAVGGDALPPPPPPRPRDEEDGGRAAVDEEEQRLRACRARRFAAFVRRRQHATDRVDAPPDGQQLQMRLLARVSQEALERVARGAATYLQEQQRRRAKSAAAASQASLQVASLLEVFESLLALLQVALGLYGDGVSPAARQEALAVYQYLDGVVQREHDRLAAPLGQSATAQNVFLAELGKLLHEGCIHEVVRVIQVVARSVLQQQAARQGERAADFDEPQLMNAVAVVLPNTFNALLETAKAFQAKGLLKLQERRKMQTLVALTLDAVHTRALLAADVADQAALRLRPALLFPLEEAAQRRRPRPSTAAHWPRLPLVRQALHHNRRRRLSRFDAVTWRFEPLAPPGDAQVAAPGAAMGVGPASLTEPQRRILRSLLGAREATLQLLGADRWPSADELSADAAQFDALVAALQRDVTRDLRIDDAPLVAAPLRSGCEAHAPLDPRRCALCGTGEPPGDDAAPDDDADAAQWVAWEREKGRLLPLGDARHVHLHCLRWCEEVREAPGGLLHHAAAAVDANLRVRCALCGQPGASLLCAAQRRCRGAYHLPCARAAHCLLLERRGHATAAAAAEADAEDAPPLCLLCPAHLDLCAAVVGDASAQRSAGRVGAELLAMRQLSRGVFDLWRPRAEQSRRRLLLPIDLDDDADAADAAGADPSPAAARREASASVAAATGDERSADDEAQRRFAQLLVQRRHRGDRGVRLGALTVHRLGQLVVPDHPADGGHTPRALPGGRGFVTPRHLYPLRFAASRLFWSYARPGRRTAYHCDVLCLDDLAAAAERAAAPGDALAAVFAQLFGGAADGNADGDADGDAAWDVDGATQFDGPIFRIAAADDAGGAIYATSLDAAHGRLLRRLRLALGDRRVVCGLTAHQFFGVGVGVVRRALELCPEALSAVLPAQPQAPRYQPSYVLPTQADALRLERRRRQQSQRSGASAGQRRRRLCSRAQRLRPSGGAPSGGGAASKLRTKVADADDGDDAASADDDGDDDDAAAQTAAAASAAGRKRGAPPEDGDEGDEDADGDDDALDAERLARQREEEELEKEAQADDRRRRYVAMRADFSRAPNARLEVRRSGIHGWGLFSRLALDRDAAIVEYVGEQVRQAVADRREVLYEAEGVGSCYLFRLDKEVIVDATRAGGMARFINHSCDPNAYARIIAADTRDDVDASAADGAGAAAGDGGEKHIVIMALREIQPGEEITYDYKFPIEDKKLRCFCGSARCSGSMN